MEFYGRVFSDRHAILDVATQTATRRNATRSSEVQNSQSSVAQVEQLIKEGDRKTIDY